jgi:hypothetical protein
MLSRILWILAAGAALVGGIVMQDGDSLFSWTDRHEISMHDGRPDEDRVRRAIDHGFDKMQVMDADGEEIELPDDMKRALAEAVGRLVKAETDLAIARIGDDDEQKVASAQVRRNQARADVDRMKAHIRNFERSSAREHDALRDEIRREIREDVRDTVRDAVQS